MLEAILEYFNRCSVIFSSDLLLLLNCPAIEDQSCYIHIMNVKKISQYLDTNSKAVGRPVAELCSLKYENTTAKQNIRIRCKLSRLQNNISVLEICLFSTTVLCYSKPPHHLGFEISLIEAPKWKGLDLMQIIKCYI